MINLKYFSSLKMHIKSLITHKRARIIKHFVWVGVVLGATIGCLITITDHIKYLNSCPTATTISTIRQRTLMFPAVTVCNLNIFGMEELEIRNLTDLLQSAIGLVNEEGTKICEEELESVSQLENLNNVTYEELTASKTECTWKISLRTALLLMSHVAI